MNNLNRVIKKGDRLVIKASRIKDGLPNRDRIFIANGNGFGVDPDTSGRSIYGYWESAPEETDCIKGTEIDKEETELLERGEFDLSAVANPKEEDDLLTRLGFSTPEITKPDMEGFGFLPLSDLVPLMKEGEWSDCVSYSIGFFNYMIGNLIKNGAIERNPETINKDTIGLVLGAGNDNLMDDLSTVAKSYTNFEIDHIISEIAEGKGRRDNPVPLNYIIADVFYRGMIMGLLATVAYYNTYFIRREREKGFDENGSGL